MQQTGGTKNQLIRSLQFSWFYSLSHSNKQPQYLPSNSLINTW